MAPTTDNRCDWCYGPVVEADLDSRLGRALGAAEAAACGSCVEAGLMMKPPDSLNVEPVTLSGEVAWALAVLATTADGDRNDEMATAVLRRIAGYD